MVRILGSSVVFLVLLAPALAQNAAAPAPSTTQSNASATLPSGDYVGREVCVTCHADQDRRLKKTGMGQAFEHPKTDAERLGCETCHGPGRVHVEAGGGEDTIGTRFTKDAPTPVAQ